MNEFGWWLLIVGLVVGAGLVWLVLADSARRESDVDARELPAEAAWIADAMAEMGRPLDPAEVEEVLRLHRAYLAAPPPDTLVSTAAEVDAAAEDVASRPPPEAVSDMTVHPTVDDRDGAGRTAAAPEVDAGTHR